MPNLADIEIPEAFRWHSMILSLAGGDVTKYDEIKFNFDVCDYVMQQCYKKYENYCEQIFLKRNKQQ